MRRPWVIASAAAVMAAGGALAAVLTTGPATTTGPAPPAGEPGPTAAVGGRESMVATIASPVPGTSAPAAAPVPGTSGDGYARNVTAGAACSPVGAVGFSAQATLLRCAPDTADPQPRWRRP
ncbi:hypothetical protein [Dactylosporangium sp. NPDC049140]|uniref:hypothetical protein n=1 Tax=Dactylosporangium sp. NPDC049140 TaxID=3155647 RepID=UPI003403CD53